MMTTTEAQDVKVEYEHGRSDGAADGAVDAQWYPARSYDTRMELKATRDANYSRRSRAYALGYERGYREETEA